MLPPAYVVRREGNSFTLFVCPHLGGRSGPADGGGQVQPTGGGGQVQPKGGGQVQPTGGGGVRSSRLGGGGQVQPAGGGVSILRPLAGGMPLAFTQEDFLVIM